MSTEAETAIHLATSHGDELDAQVVHLARYEVVFDVYGPEDTLRTSEVLDKLTVTVRGRTVYEGKATISSLVSNGGGVTCKALLDERGINAGALANEAAVSFGQFQQKWLAGYRILSEFKVVVADIEIFLVNLRQWVEEIELAASAGPNGKPSPSLELVIQEAGPGVIAAFNSLHERFEDIAYRIAPELRSVHQNYARRRLHPLFLSAPFAHRTYYKPLGYAGDYEMMNMIMRNTVEGSSLFARLVHLWLVRQWPAQSVRNRIAHLRGAILEETARVARSGGRARILNIGCGPAWEVQEFLRESLLSNDADFTFMDFDAETLAYVQRTLDEANRTHGRRAGITTVQSSVQQLLKRALQSRRSAPAEQYDMIYCAGLFDYLSSATCKALVSVCHDWLRPGGLVVAANMNDSQPFRNMIEFLLDWFLIYRDAAFMGTLRPDTPSASATVIAEPTTVNLFVHVRKVMTA